MKTWGNLSISIVNFNSGDFLLNCLESLKEIKDEARVSVWIVDNGSKDDSLKKAKLAFPYLNYIENKENLGFGKAHNIVLKRINTKYILFLNPDTELKKGVISTILKVIEDDPNIGAASCKVVLSDGAIDWASHRGFPTPLASLLYFLGDDSLYHLRKKLMDRPHEVDAISGAFFLTRREVLKKVGFFDEDYFLYAEDIDLCFRIKQAGYKVIYIPTVSIVHYKGVSSGLKKHSQTLSSADFKTRARALDAFYKTMKIFYKKNLEEKYPKFVNWLVYLGIDLKWWFAKRSLTV